MVASGELEETTPPQDLQKLCNYRFCDVHAVEFQAFQIPIRYGFPAPGEPLSVGLLEHGCRYRLVRKSEFPHAAPKHANGGCIVMDDSEKVGLRCACPVCSSNEDSWQEAYRRRTDVTQYGSGQPATQYQNLESELHLRIQELRALDETAIADCLQNEWDRHTGEESMRTGKASRRMEPFNEVSVAVLAALVIFGGLAVWWSRW